MDFQSLRAFITVADHSSFSIAAELLHLTQSAVSKRISNLEHQLDTPLFDRLGKHCQLTQAGKVLLPQARSILNSVEDSKQLIQNLKGAVGGQLKLATSHHIGLHRLPPILKTYLSEYAAVDLQLTFLASEQICEKVEQGVIELGVVTLPLEQKPNLYSIPIWHDPLSIVVGKEFSQNQITQIADLGEMGAILPERGTFTRELVEQQFAEQHIPIKEVLSTNYLETIKMLVSVGLGWSVLPDSMLSEDVKPLKTSGFQLGRSLGLVFHKSRTLSNAAKKMITLIEEHSDKK